jgi:hypothetical protein
MARMFKFSSGPLAEDPHHWGDVFCRTTMSNGQERLEISCSERQVEVLRDLTAELEAPYWILYVLIVARTGQESGRYELSLWDRLRARWSTRRLDRQHQRPTRLHGARYPPLSQALRSRDPGLALPPRVDASSAKRNGRRNLEPSFKPKRKEPRGCAVLCLLHI